MKKYILYTFKYRELGENFTKKMKEAVAGLKVMPAVFVCKFIELEKDIYVWHKGLFVCAPWAHSNGWKSRIRLGNEEVYS